MQQYTEIVFIPDIAIYLYVLVFEFAVWGILCSKEVHLSGAGAMY